MVLVLRGLKAWVVTLIVIILIILFLIVVFNLFIFLLPFILILFLLGYFFRLLNKLKKNKKKNYINAKFKVKKK